jgi:osmoprotectant transport system substrate-binding protein
MTRIPLRRTLAAALVAGSLLATSACAGDDLAEDESGGSGGGGETIQIATASFDEAVLMAALYEGVLEDADYEVDVTAVDARATYMGDFPGEFDVVPEYVAALGDHLNVEANGEGAEPISASDVDEALSQVGPLAEDAGITLLEPSPAASQNAFFVTQEYSDANGVTALSDLEGESVVLAAAPDCEGRPDCEGGLTEVYGIDVSKLLPLGYASPETYKSVLDGESDLGLTGTLDGTLDDQGLVLLEDDRGIQPAQNLVPAVSSDFLADHEDVRQPLEDLMAALDNETLGELIARVTVDREQAEDVAEDFVEQEGLVSD